MSKAGIQVPARVRGAIGNPLDVLNEVEPIFSGIESSEVRACTGASYSDQAGSPACLSMSEPCL